MHDYSIQLTWTGHGSGGTTDYRAYTRDYRVEVPGKPVVFGSADPQFRGDAQHYNPEEMLVMSLAACHMLWYLHLCADAGVVVTGYRDAAFGRMQLETDGGGQFTQVILQPMVTLANETHLAQAKRLHDAAHAKCFIARSVNFPVLHRATYIPPAPASTPHNHD